MAISIKVAHLLSKTNKYFSKQLQCLIPERGGALKSKTTFDLTIAWHLIRFNPLLRFLIDAQGQIISSMLVVKLF
jgi:hypothetical protein